MKTSALVVEDDPLWLSELAFCLRDLFDRVDEAATLDIAWTRLTSRHYDLMTVDLSMVAGVKPDQVIPDERGFELLARLRQSGHEAPTALVIVTGFPSIERIRHAFAEFDVDDFIEKDAEGEPFDCEVFASRIRRVILRSRIRAAARRRDGRPHATIMASTTHLISVAVSGKLNSLSILGPEAVFDAAGFGQKADRINKLIDQGGDQWRDAAKKLGTTLYKTLTAHAPISRVLSSAIEKSTRTDPTVLELAGPPELLRVPFELMTSGNDYLCFDSIIARRLTVDDMPGSATRPFHEFIAHIRAVDQPLNVLLIGVDSDQTIPGAEAEIGEIETRLHRICDSIALPHSIETLSGAAATYDEVRDRLAGGTVHILHYAGHGTFSRILPEESGIVLDVGSLARTLTAGELKQLLAGSGVQLAFLSCCISARTAQRLGRGDFHGTMEAVARAGVPTVIGYRWIVFDDPARAFASKFYEELMTTFSPGIAMLRARIEAASDRLQGRNNSTWASPVLVSQVSP